MTKGLPSVLPSRTTQRDRMGDTMRRASIALSLPGLGLMVIGFAVSVIAAGNYTIPGAAMLTLNKLSATLTGPVPLSFLAMSAGIVILASLPVAKVVLALWLYVKTNNRTGVITALVVLLELVASSQVGRR